MKEKKKNTRGIGVRKTKRLSFALRKKKERKKNNNEERNGKGDRNVNSFVAVTKKSEL